MSKSEGRYNIRVLAINDLSSGKSVYEVARVVGTSERTIFSWMSRYRAGGYNGLKDGVKSGRRRKISAEVMAWLYKSITRGSPNQYQFDLFLWTLNTVKVLLWQEKKISLGKSSVSRLLIQMGLSPQKPIFKSYKQDHHRRVIYLEKTYPNIKNMAKESGATIYFADEAAIRSDSHRGTTWGKVGETPVVRDSGDRFGLNLISAISVRGDMRFSVIEGRMKMTAMNIMLSLQKQKNLIISFFQMKDTKYSS